MIFHLRTELPDPSLVVLDHESPDLTSGEVHILKEQIRRNAVLVEAHILRLDLFVNKERYPRREDFLQKIRKRMGLLMAENDTFRKVLWRHYQKQDLARVSRIKVSA